VIVTIAPGANRDNVLKALTYVHQEVFNTRSTTGTVADRYNAYIRWVADAVRMLRRQIRPSDLDELVLTRRYWALQSQPTSPVDPVGVLVETELDEREAALDEARRSLERQIEAWTRPGLFVVADSSFYIHHPQKIDELDLREVLEIRELPVHLVLPIAVVDELDRLKEHSKKHVRWRARHTLQVLDQVLPDPGGPGRLREEDYTPVNSGGIPRGQMTVQIMLDPPSHRRLPIIDDEIIDRALAIQGLIGQPIRFITYDTGQSTRARSAGLTAIKISQPPEGDEPLAK
jgi:PIN domain